MKGKLVVACPPFGVKKCAGSPTPPPERRVLGHCTVGQLALGNFADFARRVDDIAEDEAYRYAPPSRPAITGPQLQFFDLGASWPGSAHDSRIFDNSRARVHYEEGTVPGILLGDKGYPCRSYLMTPFRDKVTKGSPQHSSKPGSLRQCLAGSQPTSSTTANSHATVTGDSKWFHD
ncbi:hypothetical protein HPB50_010465 [Hyalomma asiaticum]|uniref:Uncharacterized protein n=1 Tax=Hyalomma asiaticum TaxID=266040 RepID=A0ACB7SX99_HYAAI|nr:hypothetical protein HPB50_010465 [Hyalomma asiaticum]